MGSTLDFLKNKTVRRLSYVGAFVGITAIFKDYMQGEKFTNDIKATDKIVVITGANTGIGKETAKELAKRGAHVYMACRDMDKCEEARKDIVLDSKNKYVYCRKCDLASFKSIKNFVNGLKNEINNIDILINNAGVMRCPRSLTEDGIELQLGVNHMGHFLLTNLLLDLLKKSTPSRIIVVSSIAHTRGKINYDDLNSDKNYDKSDAYNQSKLANLLFARELAKRLKDTNITVNSVHPGIVSTELMRHMSIFNSFFSGIFIKPFVWPFLKNPRAGAQTTIFAALDPSLDKVSGIYFSECKPKEAALVGEDSKAARWLWAVSESWTKLNE